MSYVIRRVYIVKPGAARKVATNLAKQAAEYEKAGQRKTERIYFNGGTLPGETNRVYWEWTADIIDSPYREGHVIPQSVSEAGKGNAGLVESNYIEFYELLTPAKYQES